jgi:hypothetical protein
MPLLREFQQSGAISEYDDCRRKPHLCIVPRRPNRRNDRPALVCENSPEITAVVPLTNAASPGTMTEREYPIVLRGLIRDRDELYDSQTRSPPQRRTE